MSGIEFDRRRKWETYLFVCGEYWEKWKIQEENLADLKNAENIYFKRK